MATLGSVAQAEVARVIAAAPEEARLGVALLAELVKRLYAADLLDKADLRALVAVIRAQGVTTRITALADALDAELAD